MYTIVSLILFLLIVIFTILLFFKSKKIRQDKLESGLCPVCGATTKQFTDKSTNTIFKVEAISKRVLKTHGCSGITEYEYKCNSCGLKEVHNSVAQSCNCSL